MNVESILERKGTDVASIDAEASVLQAAELMNTRRIGALVVTRGDKAVGIFTERDILTRVVAPERSPRSTRVGDVMTSPMACCRRDTPLTVCRAIVTGKRIRHLPVVEEGRLYGLISAGDLLANEVEQQQHTIEYLYEYLHRTR
ncbi:MAG TPA: CBS domain-containing protein [Phycisphaerae bacterium]|nr:CBS domain-containing protein [Phycisphaerae bacterium]HNU44598.1 CBS domain-containing protein [Phycisphaerae bacterium]